MIGGALKLAGSVCNPSTEDSDLTSMRCELQSTISSISSDLKTIDINIGAMKGIATETNEMVVDIKYKEGIDFIDSNYDVFLMGLKNYEKTHSRFSSFIVELETKARVSFKQENIQQLLEKVAKSRGKAYAKQLASYVLIVRAKYLQIITAFYLYDNDTERVEEEFKSFNNDVNQLQNIHKQLFDEVFEPREPLGWENVKRKVPCVHEGCNIKVPLNELMDHVIEKHGGYKQKPELEEFNDDTCNSQVQFSSRVSNMYKAETHPWPVFYCNFSGHTFIIRLMKREKDFYAYVKILAEKNVASKFVVDLEVVNPNNNTSLKCPELKLYPVDMKWKDVIKDEDGVLLFDQNLALRFIRIFDNKNTEYQKSVNETRALIYEKMLDSVGLNVDNTEYKYKITMNVTIKKKQVEKPMIKRRSTKNKIEHEESPPVSSIVPVVLLRKKWF